MTNKKTRNKKYTPIATSVPMIVNREIHKNVETLNENTMLLAFRLGHAQQKHFDQLALMTNMMKISHQIKLQSDKSFCSSKKIFTGDVSIEFESIAKVIKSRYQLSGKLEADCKEISALKNVIAYYDYYWKRQSTSHYNHCVAELNLYHAEVKPLQKG